LYVISSNIPGGGQAPFEQGDNIPKLYGGFQEIKSSHLSTFTIAVSEVIAAKYK